MFLILTRWSIVKILHEIPNLILKIVLHLFKLLLKFLLILLKVIQLELQIDTVGFESGQNRKIDILVHGLTLDIFRESPTDN
uniref:Uncharacterized protein n=1 Tax=Tanacetum cinerariifolium TaxID=118510 RepID=A0A699TPY0_TANCI|nr:hypothetical protein [Tanacetum cinerariifolium]